MMRWRKRRNTSLPASNEKFPYDILSRFLAVKDGHGAGYFWYGFPATGDGGSCKR